MFEYTIPAFSDFKSLAAFAKTSRLFNHYSQTALQKTKLQKLLNHVILGEQAQAEKILKALPLREPLI